MTSYNEDTNGTDLNGIKKTQENLRLYTFQRFRDALHPFKGTLLFDRCIMHSGELSS